MRLSAGDSVANRSGVRFRLFGVWAFIVFTWGTRDITTSPKKGVGWGRQGSLVGESNSSQKSIRPLGVHVYVYEPHKRGQSCVSSRRCHLLTDRADHIEVKRGGRAVGRRHVDNHVGELSDCSDNAGNRVDRIG